MKVRMTASAIAASIAVVLGVGLGVGAVATAVANTSSDAYGDANPGSPLPSATATPSYPTNESGQTYGEYRLGTVPPDLIEAATDGGKPGYVYVTDWLGKPGANPEEAAKMAQERVNDKGDIVIPVYAIDGKTQIGQFTAAHVDFE